MKNKIVSIVLIILMTTTVITGCESVAQRQATAQNKIDDAKQAKSELQNDQNIKAQKTANTEEWKAFKTETAMKISKNENRIDELRLKMKKPGTILDPIYAKKIEKLEIKNNEMKAKLDSYEKNQSDWQTFKREFNHDMDALGQSLKDFTIDNKM